MSKLVFAPFSALSGILAGVIGKKTFSALWGVIDDHEAPDPKHRETSLGKLVLALLLQGAIFRAVRGLVDHGARAAFNKLTGSWPGEKRPDPA